MYSILTFKINELTGFYYSKIKLFANTYFKK